MAKVDNESGKDKQGGPKKLMVSINSLDGNVKHHPFNQDDTVGEVHQFAYDKLVQQKDQITFDRTWVELNRERIDDSVVLASLVTVDQGGGAEPDITFSLVWDTGGGR